MFDANLNPVSNQADWIETIELINDDTGLIITDLSGVTVRVDVRSPDRYRVLSGSSENGIVTFPGYGVIKWHFTKEQMQTLCAGFYEIGVTVKLDNLTEQELIGTLPVLDGVVR